MINVISWLAVDLSVQGISWSRPGSNHYSHHTVTQLPFSAPVMSFKPHDPREQEIKHWDPCIIWTEWLSDSATVGNEDERSFTWVKLMGMDRVRGDVELHLLEAAAGVRTWTARLLNCSSSGGLMPALPLGYYTSDLTRKDQDSGCSN